MTGSAGAQDWFTPETCRVTAADLAAAAMEPELAARVEAAAATVVNGRGRLWQITTDAGEVSWLWGTYHTPDPLLLDLPQEFRAILAQARVVALEFDPLPETRAEAAANADTGWMWRSAGWADWSWLPPEVKGWIEARLEAIGWGTGYIDMLTEAGMASLLLGDPCGDFLSGLLPGQDGYIGQEAYLAGAEVTGLQQWSEFGQQLTDPARAGAARAVVQLYAAYLGPSEGGRASRALSYRLYLEGRTAELDLWAESWLDEVYGAAEAGAISAQAEGYLLVERNGLFVERALPLLQAGGAVIAVGAGHLAGDTGLVEMLRARGLRVERLPLPGEAG
ncbi:MAG: TraB/GumN family protein [Paracoccaceae bacterium]